MQSIRSCFFNFLIRNRHWLKGKLRREAITDQFSVYAFRSECEESAAKMSRIPRGVTVSPSAFGTIPAEFLIPENAPSHKIILYVHGGGYVSGSCSDHRGFVSTFAKMVGFTAVTYEYRLAPEHPFPAAVDDSLAVYRALLETYEPHNILAAGESAGGGLVLSLLLAIKESGLPQPSAAVSISPWADLTCSHESYRTKNRVSAAPLNSWHVFGDCYAGTAPKDTPLMSPLFGDLSGLPPLFINSGTDDELYGDGELFYEKARKAGVDAEFRAGHGMLHCYPLLAPLFPEASEAMNEIRAFVQKHLG